MKYPWLEGILVCLKRLLTGLPVLLQRMELLNNSQDRLAGLRTHRLTILFPTLAPESKNLPSRASTAPKEMGAHQ